MQNKLLYAIRLFEEIERERERERERKTKKEREAEKRNYAKSDYLPAHMIVHYFVMRVDRSTEDSPTSPPDIRRVKGIDVCP